MKHLKLIAVAGAAIIASSAPLLAGAPTAFAAAAPAATGIEIEVPGNCGHVTISEDRDSSGAYVDAHVDSNPCGYGIEGAICSPDFTNCSYGGDVHVAGEDSVTGHIPINSGNHHGIRYWAGNQWNPEWLD
jgi:hypothetical protein